MKELEERILKDGQILGNDILKVGGFLNQQIDTKLLKNMGKEVKRLFPEAKLAIGPSIENGFYYDFDVEKPFSEEDLAKIEEEMKKIIKEDFEIERFELPREEALKFMK